VKGLNDAGVKCAYSEEKIPSEDRIMGKHLTGDIMPALNDIKSKISGGK
jgi:hypothetical protein